jgi:hypothetical protein
MTMSKNDSEMLLDEMPEKASDVMTFNKLHEGIENGCDCIKHDGVIENVTGHFVRRLKDTSPVEEDFLSKYEQKKPFRGNGCKAACSHRGVSVYSVDETNEEMLKRELADYSRNKPKLPGIYCRFKLKENAGLIWPTGHSEGIDAYHCELLKCDAFDVKKKIEIIEICSLV